MGTDEQARDTDEQVTMNPRSTRPAIVSRLVPTRSCSGAQIRYAQDDPAQTSRWGYVRQYDVPPWTAHTQVADALFFFFDAAGSGIYARRYDASRATRIVFTSAGDRDSHAGRHERPDKNAQLWAVQWEGKK
jgi:hypothetical protein